MYAAIGAALYGVLGAFINFVIPGSNNVSVRPAYALVPFFGIAFGPMNLGHDPATFDALIDDVLQRTSLDQLEDILERPPLALSFGQQKRLALAIALALRPSTLILDEPSAGQDHRTAENFIREVLAIPGLESVYLITHDVDLALTHSDRILLFRDGRIVADGPPHEVIADTDRWIECNLRPTSLMRANARWGDLEQGFLDAESLARRIVGRERDPAGTEGGSFVVDHRSDLGEGMNSRRRSNP